MPRSKRSGAKPRSGKQGDIFSGTSRAKIYRDRRTGRRPQGEPEGHAAKPGTGPADMTCSDCGHCRFRAYGGTRYFKCQLMLAAWSRDRSTDIRAHDPACSRFEAGTPRETGIR